MRVLTCTFLATIFLASTAAAQQNGNWQTIPTSNNTEGRSECGFAAANGKLYLLGGDNPAKPIEEYDPATNKWLAKAIAPSIMHHFQAVTIGDEIYVLQAFADRNYPNQVPTPNAYSYDTKTDTWQTLPAPAADRRRGGAGAAVYKGKVYLVGGITNGHTKGTNGMLDVYDPKTNIWTALPDAPHIRDHSQAVVVGDKLYALGGRNTSLHDANNFMSFFDKVVLEVDQYDLKTGKWTTLTAKLPQGTGGGTAVAVDGKIYFIGGERATSTKPNGPQKDVYYIDPEKDTQWTKGPDLNHARNGVGGAVLNGKIYIAGGANGGPQLEVFNIK
ncbi:Kelch repeat-containing protein [Mucilaginibacter myungsuensis]|uniref:Galactose oxidase n=1 Tax=Mucilaginibacter myungsuensis TaxID=649104 RepID=A0A929PZH5_9SPHI|nr:kelch repeat-containing protein [Mucilaginibacter myungsuensis]MBE9664505.1 galactose oxidase [Mucilaginibacter myungsuensis]MDN3601350.1 kelch repeat-containing protein [Mucilaginibacter myungsuensis]